MVSVYRLYAYKVAKSKRIPKHVGMYVKVCYRDRGCAWGEAPTHCVYVHFLHEATLFHKGECPKCHLPRKGRDFEIVEVNVEEVKHV